MATNNGVDQPQLVTDGQLVIGSTGIKPVAATITAGANITVTNGPGSITIDAPTGGGTALTNIIHQVAHGFAVMDVVRVGGTDIYVYADAGVSLTSHAVGIVTTVIDVDNFILTTSGYCVGFSGLFAGAQYYLSEVIPGELSIIPAVDYTINKPVFVASSSTAGYFINHLGLFYPISPAQGGTGKNNGANTIETNSNVKFISDAPFVLDLGLGGGTITFPPIGSTIAAVSQLPSNSSPTPLNKGGTNANLTASDGGIFYCTPTAGAILAGTMTANQVLLSGISGGLSAPAWSTATYPPTTVLNQLLYSSSDNVIEGLATAVNSVLVTDGTTGIPFLGDTLPDAVQSNISTIGGTTGATVYVGNVSAGSSVVMSVGSAGFSLDGEDVSIYSIGASIVSGTITIGGPLQTGLITLGSTIGNTSLLGTINVDSLTAGCAVATSPYNNLVSSSTTITELSYVHGVTSAIQTQLDAITSGTVTSIAGTTNEITASASAGAVTLSVPSTFIAPGSIKSTTLLTSLGGILVSGASANICTDSANFAINIGTVASSGRTIAIGNTTGTTSVSINAGSGGVNFNGTVGLSDLNIAGTVNISLLTASTALALDGSKNIVSSTTTATELGYVHGVTSAIQTQINAITAGLVTSVAGTANQITASASTGAITLSIPSTFIAPGTIQSTGLLTASAGITVTAGAVNIGADSANNAINIGTVSSSGRVITIGNTTGSSSITQNVGTGNFVVGGVGASTYWVGSGVTTGTITLGSSSQTGKIFLPKFSAGVMAIESDASISTAAQLPLSKGGTNANLTATVNNLVYSSASAFALLATANDGVLVTDGGGVPSIGDTLPSPVQANIITVGGNAGQTIAIGNTGSGTSVSMYVGDGGFLLDGVDVSNYTIGDSTTTGTITIGGNAQTGDMSIGVSSDSHTVNLGGGSGEAIVNIGTSTTAAAVNVYSGSGNINLNGFVITTNLQSQYVNVTSVTASRALASDIYSSIVSSTTTATELGYVHGVTSAIQTQLNAITGGIVTGITGTANQITASASTGSVTLSIPSTFITPGTLQTTGLASLAAGVTVTGAVSNIGTDSANFAVNIGTVSSSGRTITIGNTTGSTAVNINVGTGNFVLAGVGGTTYAIGQSITTGTITIGSSSQTGKVYFPKFSAGVAIITSDSSMSTIVANNGVLVTDGSGVPTIGSTLPSAVQANITTVGGNTGQTITIGNTGTGTSIAELVGNSGFSLDGVGGSSYVIGASTTTGVITIGGTAQTGTITLGSSSGTNTINIGNGAGTGTVNIATTAAAVATVNIGRSSAGSSVVIHAGNSGFTVTGAGDTFYRIGQSTTTGTIIIGGAAQTGVTYLGISDFTNYIGIGTGDGVGTMDIATGAGGTNIHIATGAAAQAVTIGSVSSSSSMALYVGTGNYVLDGAAGSTYTVGASTTTGTIAIGGSAQTGAITLGSSSGTNTINIGTGSGTGTIHIGDAASTIHTITVGTTYSTSTTTINAGSGGIQMNGTITADRIFAQHVNLALVLPNRLCGIDSSNYLVSYGVSGSNGALVSVSGSTLNVSLVNAIPGQNLLFNGSMLVWQRLANGGTTFAVSASTTVYTADRWQTSVGASTATTVSQIGGTVSGSYYCRVQRNSGQTGTAVMYFAQSLTRDMSISAISNPITLSFTALCGANFSPTSGNITVTVYSGTGTSDISGIKGAFTGSASPISVTQAITTTATNYSFTAGSPVSSSATQLCVQFSWTPVGTASTNDWIEFTNVVLTVSDTQIVYQYVPYAQELLRCMYFYQNLMGASGAFTGTASTAYIGVYLAPVMRVTPSISSTGVITVYDGNTTFTQSSAAFGNSLNGPGGGIITISNLSAGAATFRPCSMLSSGTVHWITLDSDVT